MGSELMALAGADHPQVRARREVGPANQRRIVDDVGVDRQPLSVHFDGVAQSDVPVSHRQFPVLSRVHIRMPA